MADRSACQTPVVLGFESRSDQYLDLFHSSTQFKSSATLVYIQLVCLLPVEILNSIMFNFNYWFQLFARVHKTLCSKHCRGYQ